MTDVRAILASVKRNIGRGSLIPALNGILEAIEALEAKACDPVTCPCKVSKPLATDMVLLEGLSATDFVSKTSNGPHHIQGDLLVSQDGQGPPSNITNIDLEAVPATDLKVVKRKASASAPKTSSKKKDKK